MTSFTLFVSTTGRFPHAVNDTLVIIFIFIVIVIVMSSSMEAGYTLYLTNKWN
jgi:hypothetical protein